VNNKMQKNFEGGYRKKFFCILRYMNIFSNNTGNIRLIRLSFSPICFII